MLAVLLATLSAASYGASDFSGALASKEHDATLIAVYMQVVSLAALIIIVPFFGGEILATDLAWGALGGVGAAVGLTMFYQALAAGPMSTAASLTALTSAATPVAAGLALGDRLSTMTAIGIGLAIPAAVMVSAGGTGLHATPIWTTPREFVAGQRDINRTRTLSIVAGLGFGLFFVALSRTSADGGLYPLLGARLGSIVAISSVLTISAGWGKVSRRWWPIVVVAGLLDCAANSFYLTALDHGSFTWVAALSSLYPVSTVLLARIVLKESLVRVQIVGMALAGVALSLVAVGA